MLSPDTLAKVREFYKTNPKSNEMIQEGDKMLYLKFTKGKRGQLVAELTDIESNEVITLEKKASKPATLIDFRMQCFAENDKKELQDLGEKITNQIVNAIKQRRLQPNVYAAQLEFDWESHPCFVVIPEANGPVYVFDCADFLNPTSKQIVVKKSEKKQIGILQMLQPPVDMKERFLKTPLDMSNIEYRFAKRLFMETKGQLNFDVVGLYRL